MNCNTITFVYVFLCLDTITCQTCQTSSTTQTSFRTLALALPEDDPEAAAEPEEGAAAYPRLSFQTLLSNLVKPETLEEENKYCCACCGDKVVAERKTRIVSLPKLLAVQLKRFRFDTVRHTCTSCRSMYACICALHV
ncbi:hypothetical protein EON64_12990 [archaeon]|nr:MAG: hypothetical protein EON64_12990 [archaeon]